jgi:hypothetical protein
MPSKHVHKTRQAHQPEKGWQADNIVDWPRTLGMSSPRRGTLKPPLSYPDDVDHSVWGGGPQGHVRLPKEALQGMTDFH